MHLNSYLNIQPTENVLVRDEFSENVLHAQPLQKIDGTRDAGRCFILITRHTEMQH